MSALAGRTAFVTGSSRGIGDVTSLGDVERMRGEIEQRLGPVDVLVANAGGNPARPGPIEELSEEAWHASIDANLTSTFLLPKSFLPGMKARGYGSIITLSSAAARRPTVHSPFAYAAAKAGVAQAALFLAADTSSWISGVVLDVAGGSVLI